MFIKFLVAQNKNIFSIVLIVLNQVSYIILCYVRGKFHLFMGKFLRRQVQHLILNDGGNGTVFLSLMYYGGKAFDLDLYLSE